jgi:hypothetical protein
VFLRVGHYQRAFLTATEYAASQANQQQKLREFHGGEYTARHGLPLRLELLSTPSSRMR